MSKILKAKTLEAYPLYVPELKTEEEETFIDILIPKPQEEKVSVVQECDPEERLSEQEVKSFEQELEELRRIAKDEGFKTGYEEGYRAGFEKGYKDGQKRAELELEALFKDKEETLRKEYEELRNKEIERLRNLLSRIEEEFRNLTLDLDQEIVTLLRAILQKLILREIREDKALLYRIVREALNYIVEGTELVIHVNPEELGDLEEAISNLPQVNKIKFIPDESITKGGVFIETKLGTIDATLEKRINNLFELLEKEEAIGTTHEIQGI